MAVCVQAMNLRNEAPLRSSPGWPVAPTGMAGREGGHEGRYVVGSVAAAGRDVLRVCHVCVLGHRLGCPGMGRHVTGLVPGLRNWALWQNFVEA